MDDGEIALRIEAFNQANGHSVGWYEGKDAYHLCLLVNEVPIARLKLTGKSNEVRITCWSHRRKWEGRKTGTGMHGNWDGYHS